MSPAPPPPLVIGVLGGIASGKSQVARLLAGPRGVVLDADRLAHEALESEAVRAWLRATLGASLVGPQGVDRRALAEHVFRQPALRRELEQRVHPAVRERLREGLAAGRREGRERIVLDVPLLLENDAQHQLTGECHVLVFVECDATVRAERAQRTRGWSGDELARREQAQLPLDVKRARADLVLDNSGDLAQLSERVADALREIASRFAQP